MGGTDWTAQSVREGMRALAANLLTPAAAEIDRTEQYPFEHAKALADAGFVGMTIPKALGGGGASFEMTCIAVEEAAKACGISGRIVVDSNMGAVPAIMAYGTDAQKARTAELVLAGDKPAICFTEPTAGSDATAMKTRAERRGSRAPTMRRELQGDLGTIVLKALRKENKKEFKLLQKT